MVHLGAWSPPCCVHDMEAISPICRQLAVSRSYQPLACDGRSAPPQSTFLKNTKAVRRGHVFATSSPASTRCVWAHLSHLPAAFYPSFLLRTATHSLCRLQRKCLASATFFYLRCTAPPHPCCDVACCLLDARKNFRVDHQVLL